MKPFYSRTEKVAYVKMVARHEDVEQITLFTLPTLIANECIHVCCTTTMSDATEITSGAAPHSAAPEAALTPEVTIAPEASSAAEATGAPEASVVSSASCTAAANALSATADMLTSSGASSLVDAATHQVDDAASGIQAQQLYFVATLSCKAPWKQEYGGVPKENLMHSMLKMVQTAAPSVALGGDEVKARHAYGVFVVLSGPAEAVLHACAAAAGVLQTNNRHDTFRGKRDHTHVPFLCTVDIVGTALSRQDLPDMTREYDLRLQDDEHEELVFGGACNKRSLLLRMARREHMDELARVVDSVPTDDPRYALAALAGKQLVALPSVYDHDPADERDNGFVGAPPRWTTTLDLHQHEWTRPKPVQGTVEWDTMMKARKSARVDKRKWLISTRSPKQAIKSIIVRNVAPPVLHRVMTEGWIAFVQTADVLVPSTYMYRACMLQRWPTYVPTVQNGQVHDNPATSQLRPRTAAPQKSSSTAGRGKRAREDITRHLEAGRDVWDSVHNTGVTPKAPRRGDTRQGGKRHGGKRQGATRRRSSTGKGAVASIPPPRAAGVASSARSSQSSSGDLSGLMSQLGITHPSAGSGSSSSHAAQPPRRAYSKHIAHKAYMPRDDTEDDSDGSDEVVDSPSAAARDAHVPTSAVPSSAVPSSAVPSSAAPSSAAPSSAAPSSAAPSSTTLLPPSGALDSAVTTSAGLNGGADSAAQRVFDAWSRSTTRAVLPDHSTAYASDPPSLARDAVSYAPCPEGVAHVTGTVLRKLQHRITDIVLGMMGAHPSLQDAVTYALTRVDGSGVQQDYDWCIHRRDIAEWETVMNRLSPYVHVTKMEGNVDSKESSSWVFLTLEGNLGCEPRQAVQHVQRCTTLRVKAACFQQQKLLVSHIMTALQDASVEGLE